MNETRCFLKQVDLFQGFSDKELKEVEKKSSIKSYPKGQVFYGPDDAAELLFILKKGKVRIYELSRDGKEFTLAILNGGTIFGEMVLVGQGMYDAFAEALENSELCVMNKKDVEQLITDHPKLALKIIEIIGNRLRQTEEKLGDLAFRDVTSRLASLLLRLADEGENNSNSTVLGDRFTHQELAEMIGTSRETLTRALGDLKTKKLISVDHKKIHVLDRESLEQVSLTSQ